MRLLDLLRRRRLAYDLLAAHDAENLPADPEAYKRSMETISKWAVSSSRTSGGTVRLDDWRAAVEACISKHPSA